MLEEKKIALVTGANRGLGFETARVLASRGYHVWLGVRDEAAGRRAAEKFAAGAKVDVLPLDVSDSGSIERACARIEAGPGRLDVLVNNAGIFVEGTAVADIERSMRTNVYGPYELCRRLTPLMKRRGYGRVVNLSSGMGQLTEMNGGYPAYRLSKTALNAVTRIFADELAGTGVLVNSVCPGWVRTDMGGSEAEISVEEGADTIVWLATLPPDGPSGGFFRERKPIPW